MNEIHSPTARLAPVLHILLVLALLLPALLMTAGPVHAQQIGATEAPIVRAILFYSPTCPHCHEVIQNDLPPLMEQYGDQLQIIGIDVSQDWGQALYQAAIRVFNIAEDQRGVPALIIGDRLLVGSGEIPAYFPDLIVEHLANGGVDWPAIPELQMMIAQSEAAEAAEAAASQSETESPADTPIQAEAQAEAQADTEQVPVVAVAADASALAADANRTWQERFQQDPTGNGLSLVVLAAMLAGLVGVIRPFFGKENRRPSQVRWPWLTPVLAVAGLGVAAYLAYIETTQSTAICGPVGDCNAVQQSSYAQLFGVPIAIYGLAGYVAILALWAVWRWGSDKLAAQAATGIFGVAVVGVLFSIYLTFLEPFVIGATCIWCLSSAVIMTALLLISAGPGRAGLQNMMGQRR